MLSTGSSIIPFNYSYGIVYQLQLEYFAVENLPLSIFIFVMVFLLIFGFKRGFSRVLLEFSKILIFPCDHLVACDGCLCCDELKRRKTKPVNMTTILHPTILPTKTIIISINESTIVIVAVRIDIIVVTTQITITITIIGVVATVTGIHLVL